MQAAPDGRRAGLGGEIDVVCVGNALMDHLAFAEHELLDTLGLPLGSMTLVDIPTTIRIGQAVGGSRQVPGGTVTNTAVGIASFGGHPAFVGAVADDEVGDRYAADLATTGVAALLERFAADPEDSEAATGRCFVIVTPDGERTMATALGVGGRLDRSGIDTDVLAAAQLVYFDGYLLDLPDASAIVDRILDATRRSAGSLAVGLSDALLVERHHGTLSRLVAEDIDILFANEAEMLALSGRRDVADALDAIARPGLVAVATCGPEGALISQGGEVIGVPVIHVDRAVDRTGAGDLFAAGFCYGVTHGAELAEAAALGSLAAAEVITHLGARPERSLAALAAEHGLLTPAR